MKVYSMLSILCMLLVTGAYAQPVNPFDGLGTARDKKLPETVTKDWFASAVGNLEFRANDFKYNEKDKFFYATNSSHRLQFRVAPSGYTVYGLANPEASWHVQFRLLDKKADLSRPVTSQGSKIVYHYQGADVEYLHSANGLRQNFIIRNKVAGAGQLVVKLKVHTSLEATDNGQNKVSFHLPGDRSAVKLVYDDLHVWDANHTVLPARMVYNKKTSVISLVVDDKNAVYPVTIDPLNHTEEWRTSADGIVPALLSNLQLQVHSLYGFTVAGLGDVNNDGFDDVAISAPGLADIIAGSGSLASVGAVFIYFGSSAGLPTQPSLFLQPNTLIAGSLFGYSVTAGDVTGDGINDILIGAPLDGLTLDIGSGNFINGKVGKVYIYQGGSLSGTNPTPLLSVSLTTSQLNATNIQINPLFGFSLAVADDLNGDGKGEIVVGAPTYARLNGASYVRTGGAFVFLSNAANTFSTVRSLTPPTGSVLGLHSAVGALVQAIPITGGALWLVAGPLLQPVLDGQIEGLLFGFSVDGVGDFNNDGTKDVVVGAPAGVNLGSLTSGLSLDGLVANLLSGQVLGGSAYIFSGTGVPATGISTTAAARLQAQTTGLLSNTANLFGYHVKGVRYTYGGRSGNVLVGAPAGSVITDLTNLKVKAGQLHVFLRKTGSFSNPVAANQVLSSPRANTITSILTGQTLNLTLLYASSFDVLLDANCDGYADLVVGEPLSTAVGLINTDVVGGAAYIYYGNSSGTYATSPAWSLVSEVSPTLGVNATAMIGRSVANAGYTMGTNRPSRALIGGASNSLDFGAGLLNLGNTLGTLTSFAFDENGVGKAYTFASATCNITLPASLLSFTGEARNKTVELKWLSEYEENVNAYDLERSTDGLSFQPIAMVFARGEQRNNYQYLDRLPYMGTNFYRLKIKDNDGRFKYSDIVMVRFNEKIPGDITVAPNPVVSGPVKVKMTGLDKGTYAMKLYNSAGQEVFSRQVTISQHDQIETINNTNALVPGIYWLNVYDKNQSQRFKTVRVLINRE